MAQAPLALPRAGVRGRHVDRGRRPDRAGPRGKLAATLVPFAYIAWSVWLLALGIGLFITA
jgi:hypothetical protein